MSDFGIARFGAELLVTAVETKAGDKLANFRYAAPEQQVRGADVDHRADIYALGLMLNEMFTGQVIHGSGHVTIESVSSEHAYLDAIVDHMRQQSAAARPNSIDEIKQALIGHKNAFIARQRLDEAKREIVPASEPVAHAPIKLKGKDWQNGNLIFILDRAPHGDWVNRFQQPRGNSSSVYGAGPKYFQFDGVNATVRVDEGAVPKVVEHFNDYLEMANSGYEEDLRDAAARAERVRRHELELRVAEEEKRARILRQLNG